MGINLADYLNEDNIKLTSEQIKELVAWYINEYGIPED